LNFYSEYYIYLAFILSGLLILIFIFGFQLKKKLLNNFGDINIISRFSKNINLRRYYKKYTLLIISVFLIFLTLARPQWGNKMAKITRKGLNILVMLDVSKSMLAEDMKPSRLKKAKHQISRLVNYLKGDRIGLLIFAGTSFLQCPLTIDYSAFKMYLDNVSVDSIPVPGTNLPDALLSAIRAFPEVDKKYKVIILLTDGENHQGDMAEISKKIKDENIIVYTIGVGTPNGELIPLRDGYGNVVGYKKDKTGNPILSKLDEVTLEKIALYTDGKYYQATESEFELKKVYDDILKMERKLIYGKQFSQQEDRFQWFLIPAILLLMYELIKKEREV